jgi:hypothetical protein
MNTIFLRGVQPQSGFRIGQRHSMGQSLSKADRDHYLVAIERALKEADEIDAWLLANPLAKLKPTELEMAQASDVVISPFFSKWINFQAARPDMVALRDRLKNEDSSTWGSLTDPEHKTFGWVSVVDQVFGAFKADPKNLTAGRWVAGVRQPDPVSTGGTTMPTMPMEPVTILGHELPPTLLGMPTKVALVVGTMGLISAGVALWAVFRKK